MNEKTIRVEVHYEAEFAEKNFDKVLKAAKESGCGYGEDPGPKEIVRRFLMSNGVDEGTHDVIGNELSYQVLPPTQGIKS